VCAGRPAAPSVEHSTEGPVCHFRTMPNGRSRGNANSSLRRCCPASAWRLQALDAIGPTEAWLDGVPPGKVAHFAGEPRMANVGDIRKTGEAKRVTLRGSLLHQQRVEARDEVVTMFCKRGAALHKKGDERLDELREAHRAETERLIGNARDQAGLGAARAVRAAHLDTREGQRAGRERS
jgi:hypothetical protein